MYHICDSVCTIVNTTFLSVLSNTVFPHDKYYMYNCQSIIHIHVPGMHLKGGL